MLEAAGIVHFVTAMWYLHHVAGRIPSQVVRQGTYTVALLAGVGIVGMTSVMLFTVNSVSVGCMSAGALFVLPFLLGSVLHVARREIRALLRRARERDAPDAVRAGSP
jgi:hypothetical protein